MTDQKKRKSPYRYRRPDGWKPAPEKAYAVVAVNRKDPSDVRGLCCATRISCKTHHGGHSHNVPVFADNLVQLYVPALDWRGTAAQAKWNELEAIARSVAAGFVRREKRTVTVKWPTDSDPGRCFTAAVRSKRYPDACAKKATFDFGTKKFSGWKRFAPEEYRIFVTRVRSAKCPIEVSPAAFRALRRTRTGKRSSMPYAWRFEPKRGFEKGEKSEP